MLNNGGDNTTTEFEEECTTALSTAIAVVSPNGLNHLQFNPPGNYSITWTKGDAVMAVDVELSRDNGANWEVLATDVTGTSFTWTATGPTTTQARIRVRDSNYQNRSDMSNGTFTIAPGPMLMVTPNGGETLTSLNVFLIRWSSASGPNVKLAYNINNGPIQTILASTPNDGQEAWYPPNINSSQVKVWVLGVGDIPNDQSDAFLTICQRFARDDDPAVGTPRPVIAADFNADGVSDLAFGGVGIGVHLGNGAGGVGDGTFGALQVSNAAATVLDLAAADLNRDGVLDLVTDQANGTFLRGSGAGGVGNGNFGSAQGPLLTGTAGGVAVGDFDEDGKPDVALTDATAGVVSVLLTTGASPSGDWQFAPRVDYPVQTDPRDIEAGDLDDDGILDLVVLNQGSSSFSILFGNGTGGNGDGTFAAALNTALASTPLELAIANVDVEPGLDIAMRLLDETMAVCKNSGTGTFSAPEISPVGTGGDPRAFAMMDFDGDGMLEPAVASSGTDDVTFMGGDDAAAFYPVGTVVVGTSPEGVATGDFNEDGALDLAVSNTTAGTFSILLGSNCGLAFDAALVLGSPGGGEDWASGSEQVVSWTAGLAVGAINLEISRDNGRHWELIASGLDPDGGSFDWTVTPPATDSALVRVSDAFVPSRSDASAGVFRISGTTVAASRPVPAAASFSRPWPNPARGDVRFELALPQEAEVHVEAFDLGGRRVATLAEGRFPAGYHPVRWAARGGPSGDTPAGVYFVRARWSGFEAVRRVVRMN
jgi:hypothetical protein